MLVLGVIVLATFVASFTDWVFMDLLIHRYYQSSPEVWRPRGGGARIAISQVIGTLATAAVVWLCLLVPGRAVLVALLVWCAGPLPVTLQNWQWMKLHPAVAASHAGGWLVRLLIAALLAAWLLPH
jgi:hypothetical protein